MKNNGSLALSDELNLVKDQFITEWGSMGQAWGINRAMAQIHALLLTTPHALSTDQVMNELKISRGNAHANLRELVGWGIVRSVIRKAERKELFEAEKDVWKIFCMIAQERKRREVTPAVRTLEACVNRLGKMKSVEARALRDQLQALHQFMEFVENIMEKVSKSQQNKIIPWAMKYFK